ncbi:hypothetical protein ABZ299_28020, partial [Streptomyces sp. NPDC006184]
MQLHTDDGTTGRLLFLGDLAYPTIKKIFDYSESHDRTDRIEWDVLLSPHHCSKKAMYAKGEDGEEELKQDILDQLEAHANADARVISSSRPFRDKDDKGNDPPHLLARTAYESITDYPVLCTGEYPSKEEPRPVVFALEPGLGLELVDVTDLENKGQVLKAAGGGRRLLATLGTTRFPAAAFTTWPLFSRSVTSTSSRPRPGSRAKT